MAVFRINKTRDYTVMSNYHLKDTSLTLKSKGLLSMMLSLPEEWNYTIIGIQKGDTIVKAEDIDSVTTFKGIMTAEELAEENKKGVRGGSIFGIVAGILLAIIGVGMMAFRRQ